MALQTHSASIAARIGKGIDVLSALLVLSFFPAFEACAQSSAGGQASTTAALIGASNAAGAGTNVPQTVGVETAGQPNAKALACLAAGRAILQRTSPDLNAALVQFNAAVTADSSNAQVRIVRALARTAQDFYRTLHRDGTTDAMRDRMFDFDGLNEMLDTKAILARGKQYETGGL